jgi:hypothetical protein
VQYQTKEEPYHSLQGIVVDANCEKESVKVINDDPKDTIGKARQERVWFIEKILGILRKMKDWNPEITGKKPTSKMAWGVKISEFSSTESCENCEVTLKKEVS